MIGIPVFYLKNESSKMGIKPKHSNSQTGSPVTKSPVTTSPATKDKPGQAQSLFSRFKELPIEFQTPLEEARLNDAIIKVANDVIASRENLEKGQDKAAEEEESFLARCRKYHRKNFLGPEHESTENKKWKDLQRREFISDASVVKEPSSDRLRELADLMDTLIPVEILTDQDMSGCETRSTKSTKSPRPSTDTHRSPSGNDRTLYLIERCERELTAALFMYMCCARRTDPDQSWLRANWEYAIYSSVTGAGSSTGAIKPEWRWEKQCKQWLETGRGPGLGERGWLEGRRASLWPLPGQEVPTYLLFFNPLHSKDGHVSARIPTSKR